MKVILSEQQFVDLILKSILGGDGTISGLFNKSSDKKDDSNKTYTKASVNFEDVTNQIIDQLEGGYYHPDMLKDGRVKDSRYGNSGETMFGIDRKTGGSENTSAAGREFWRLIDAENARKKWKHEYMLKDNPELARKLRSLVAKIMEPLFVGNQKRYLSPEAQEIVNSSPRLYYNFAYATWNGPGWFQRMAKDFNKKVEEGANEEELVRSVIDWRKGNSNSLVAQTGRKMEKILSSMA